MTTEIRDPQFAKYVAQIDDALIVPRISLGVWAIVATIAVALAKAFSARNAVATRSLVRRFAV